MRGAHSSDSKERMSEIQHAEGRAWHQQALFVYGTGLAVGLHIALLNFAHTGSLAMTVFILVAASVLATAAWLLWRYALPNTTHLALRPQIAVQLVLCAVVFGLLSFVFTELHMRLFQDRSALSLYDGGAVTLTFSATRVQWAPLIYASVPIIPSALLCVVGYHLHWSRILLFQSRERELRDLATTAQLAALRAQINPHFFFNSLNSIAQLIGTDPEKAEACIERLAEIFRYMLRRSEHEFVSLAEELEIADAYLEIEKARFGDDLRVTQDIDAGATAVTMPGLLLQPIVENAVKHGISRKIGGGELSIAAHLAGRDLVLEVRDTGAGIQGNQSIDGPGVGLRNVRDRLVKHYGAAYAPSVESVPGVGTTVRIRIPADAPFTEAA